MKTVSKNCSKVLCETLELANSLVWYNVEKHKNYPKQTNSLFENINGL